MHASTISTPTAPNPWPPAIDPHDQFGEPMAARRPHERREERVELLARHHDVRREHERDEEEENGAADARYDVAADPRHFERVVLRVDEALSDGGRDQTV